MRNLVNIARRTPLLHLALLVSLRALATLAASVILFASAVAVAQAPAPVAEKTDVQVVTEGAQTVIHTAQDPTSPKYLVVVAAVFFLCQLFKRFGHKTPLLGTWLTTHPWGDWVVGVVLSLSGALMAGGASGKVDIGLIMSALVTGMAASGTPLAIFGTGPAPTPPGPGAAQAAGTAAAADPGKQLNS